MSFQEQISAAVGTEEGLNSNVDICECLVQETDIATFNSISQWWKLHKEIEWKHPFAADCALVAGTTYQSLGYVFATAYQAAIKGLIHQGDPENNFIRAVCATEGSGPFHPKTVKTTIQSDTDGKWILNGEKSFVTLGSAAHQYIVLVKIKDTSEFKAVIVNKNQPGVELTELPKLPFIPEVQHAKVKFTNVKIDASSLLSGDGFADYIKPFRTVEDCLVVAGVTGFLIQQIKAHSEWNKELLERALLLALVIRELCELGPSKPTTHVTLASTFSLLHQLIEDIEKVWDSSEESFQNWKRDKRILQIAQKARDLRLTKARSLL